MSSNPVVNTLTFIGSVAGQATIQSQGIAGGLTFMLPNTSPIQGNLLTVTSINGNNVFLGWAAMQSSTVHLSQLAQDGATTGQIIEWNGTAWVASSTIPGEGTVTSVALTAPAEFSVAGSPITGAGTLAITKANQSANTVWAGPATGAAAAPTFRALVTADIGAGIVSLAAINSKQGAGSAVQIAAGSFTNGHVVVFDATGNTSDSGIPGNTVFTTAGGTLSGDISFSQTPTANINAASGGNLNLNGNGGLIQIATTGGIGIAPQSGQLVSITALKTFSTLTDSTGSVGTSGQVLSSTVTGTQWITDTEAVTSVFTRTGAVTAQSGDYSVGQVTGAAPLASPTFTGTVTLPAVTASGTITGGASGLALADASASGISIHETGAGNVNIINGGSAVQLTPAAGVSMGSGNGSVAVSAAGAISITPFTGQITTVGGHISLEGVTSTGATGTGNIVFSASPTLTGNVTASGIQPPSGTQFTISALGAGSQIALNGLSSSQILINNAGAISLTPSSGNNVQVTGSEVVTGTLVVEGVEVDLSTNTTHLVGNSDIAGTVTVSTGTTQAVTFTTAYLQTPKAVQLTPLGNTTTAGSYWVTSLGTGGFTVNIANAAVISFYYTVIG